MTVVADVNFLAKVEPELAHGLGAELDLVLTRERVAAGRGRLDDLATWHDTHDRELGRAEADLREAQLGPAQNTRLVSDQWNQRILGAYGPAAPAAGRLDEQVPVPAGSCRVRGQAGEAGAEHQRGDEGGDRDD